jgi:hypothetical protein
MTVASTFTATFTGNLVTLQEWAFENLTIENFSAYPQVQTQDDILKLVAERDTWIESIVTQTPGLVSKELLSRDASSATHRWTWQDQSSFDTFYADFISGKRNDVSGWEPFQDGRKNSSTGEFIQLTAGEYTYFLYRKAFNLNYEFVVNG